MLNLFERLGGFGKIAACHCLLALGASYLHASIAGRASSGTRPRDVEISYYFRTLLRAWPEVSGVRPLRGDLVGHFRLRTGDYRVQFRVEGETVQ